MQTCSCLAIFLLCCLKLHFFTSFCKCTLIDMKSINIFNWIFMKYMSYNLTFFLQHLQDLQSERPMHFLISDFIFTNEEEHLSRISGTFSKWQALCIWEGQFLSLIAVTLKKYSILWLLSMTILCFSSKMNAVGLEKGRFT